MTVTSKRLLIWSALGAVIVAGLALSFWPRPVPVDLVEVDRGSVVATVNEEGKTRVREVYIVSAPITGTLQRIRIEDGDMVLGQVSVLAAIRPVEPTLLDAREEARVLAQISAARANLELSRAEVERARADLAFAEIELTRARILVRREVASERSLDVAETEVKRAEAALRIAEAQVLVRAAELERAQAELMQANDALDTSHDTCCVHVIAPISGRVLRVIREDEGVVSAGEPLVELGELGDMEVVVEALSTDAVKIAEGAPVVIERWGGGAALSGTVRRIEPYGFTKISALGIEEQRVNVLVDFDDAKEAGHKLGHGYRVETQIETARVPDAVRVPLAALFRDGGGWAVFIVIEGRARHRGVTLGLLNDQIAEVIGGLAPGDILVSRPDDRIGDSVRVVSREE
ncbi:MAG: HlyD family efflux transporter periplasmic adaptor subunit [Alphaproteobacteria bacterium]|nr:HlyD family efflux transporter periplasmic adaptor subunit [Alphaproteobacteria bacterium]